MFGEIRTLSNEKGETFFLGKDVAKALGYGQPDKAIVRHVDDDDRTFHTVIDSLGRRQKAFIINESGLYSLVLSSKLPQAKAFKRWVTSEVLPQIRKTGGYIPTKNMRTGEMLTEGEVVEEATKILQRTIARENLPADDCFTATEVAKSLDMNVKDMNHMLVSKGIMYWNGSRYKLTAKYAGCGYTSERNFHYHALKGDQKQRPYLVWTEQGKEFIKRTLIINN